jgi:hypothetical protein
MSREKIVQTKLFPQTRDSDPGRRISSLNSSHRTGIQVQVEIVQPKLFPQTRNSHPGRRLYSLNSSHRTGIQMQIEDCPA